MRQAQAIEYFAGAWPKARILLQRFQDQLVERSRQFGIEERRRLRRLPHQRVQRAELRRRDERMPPRDHLVEHRAEREDVCFGRDRLASRLFGRHVADCPDDEAGLGRDSGRAGGDGGLMQPRKTEVEQLDVSVGPNHDVVGLDVPMDDIAPRARRPSASAICLAIATLRSSGRPSVGERAERSAVDEFHRDVAIVVDDACFVDRDDVRVVERGGERGLAKKPFERVIFDCQSRRRARAG